MVAFLRRFALIAMACALVLTGCTATPASDATGAESDLWDSEVVHTISVDYDQSDYDAMIQTYLDTEEKDWIEATVVIDGETYEDAGLKLKGNSSLRGLSTSADAELSSESPEDLPWLVRLDKYVDGQNHDGTTELVVRGNSSETALNEAVALGMLAEAGLASQQAIAVRFSADGSDERLRLVIENPDDGWMERELGDGMLYKAEAGGDYSYRGDDADAYAEVFDQEGGGDDLQPLIDFLEWINEVDDETFAADLDEHLDVDGFATYLAFQELVGNSDDIDGPGNNSYLYYDPATSRMTVVTWDLNLAFGASPGGGGFGGGGGDGGDRGGDGGGRPGDAGGDGGGGFGGGQGGGFGGSNVLAERFLADADFAALYRSELERLQAEIVDSGDAQHLVDQWTQTLLDGASDLVDSATIHSDADEIAGQLS
ncbi:CotH kinase family protein [Microbacterium fluvii]|uniref:CotH kinase family protein n=1 Tax=Microbacterium fluvii TaxID=415215 RepID=A0ABW2HDS6_9MICO|nr:CotH kinase family protein [Microbacterium fluvii]MCU4672289.1 CotH kinase family protein [Microbacterium fluvii]